MSGDYVLFLRAEAALFYRSLRRTESYALERFFDSLESYPHLKGETTERDEVGRAVEVKFIGRLKVVYWADHAVKEVKILRLERLPTIR
jgi:hypothetical protein